jgi:NAD+ kinase
MRRWGRSRVNVGIVLNRTSHRAQAAARELASWLEGRGDTACLSLPDAEAADLARFAVPGADLGTAGLVVALGGDGTILKAAHLLEGARVPILGVNLGRLGFMSGADADDVLGAVESALAGKVTVEERATLTATVTAGDASASYTALNEVYVGRNAPHRVVDVALAVNGVPLTSFYCDGVILATPTGSTAYALSFGGPIVSPDVDAFMLVPAGAHTLAARPIVMGPRDRIDVTFPNESRADACVSVDGDIAECLSPLERVTVVRGEAPVLLAKVDGHDFYDVLREKLLGGR